MPLDPVSVAGYAGVVVTVADKLASWVRGWHQGAAQAESIPELRRMLEAHTGEDRAAIQVIHDSLNRIERGQAVMETKVDTLAQEVNRLRSWKHDEASAEQAERMKSAAAEERRRRANGGTL